MPVSRRTFLKYSAAAASAPFLFCKNDGISVENHVQVIALGIMQDGGMPQLGCTCERCSRAARDYRARRFVTSLGIRDTEGKVHLVDTTPDIREQLVLMRSGLPGEPAISGRPVDGIFLTHAHMGHYTGLMHFGFESLSSDSIPVHCTHKMAEYLQNNGPWDQLVQYKNIVLNPFEYGDKIVAGPSLTIEPLNVPHRQEYTDTAGFVINGAKKSMLYIPDIDSWEEWTDDLSETLRLYDIAVVDGSFYSGDELPGRDMSKVPHPLITHTMDLLRGTLDLQKTQVYFTHFNHTNPVLNADGIIKKRIEQEGFYCLEQGMVFSL
ncbi:MBL fold metallo-hydrolase [candidate division KSB1 bacterium]